jgi:hypothetical protein
MKTEREIRNVIRVYQKEILDGGGIYTDVNKMQFDLVIDILSWVLSIQPRSERAKGLHELLNEDSQEKK